MGRTTRGSAVTRFSIYEKGIMKEKVANLFARPHGVMPCPVSLETWADICNSFQPPELVAAIQVLSNNPLTHVRAGRLKTNEVDLIWDKPDILFRISNNNNNGDVWQSAHDSPFIAATDEGACNHLAWVDLLDRLGSEKASEFIQWTNDCKRINADVKEAIDTFDQVIKMCNTGGQLHRIVPECIMLASVDKQQLLAKQANRSAMPEGYFKLDLLAVDRMNTFISKCRLLPEIAGNLAVYSKLTWASVR